MTNNEAAIEVLKSSTVQQMGFCKIIIGGKALSIKEAIDLAIKSLEAWEKVKEEMQEQYKAFANIPSVSDVWADAIEIVDKHLKEVSK